MGEYTVKEEVEISLLFMAVIVMGAVWQAVGIARAIKFILEEAVNEEVSRRKNEEGGSVNFG